MLRYVVIAKFNVKFCYAWFKRDINLIYCFRFTHPGTTGIVTQVFIKFSNLQQMKENARRISSGVLSVSIFQQT